MAAARDKIQGNKLVFGRRSLRSVAQEMAADIHRQQIGIIEFHKIVAKNAQATGHPFVNTQVSEGAERLLNIRGVRRRSAQDKARGPGRNFADRVVHRLRAEADAFHKCARRIKLDLVARGFQPEPCVQIFFINRARSPVGIQKDPAKAIGRDVYIGRKNPFARCVRIVGQYAAIHVKPFINPETIHLAAAVDASQPACPPPITTTS